MEKKSTLIPEFAKRQALTRMPHEDFAWAQENISVYIALHNISTIHQQDFYFVHGVGNDYIMGEASLIELKTIAEITQPEWQAYLPLLKTSRDIEKFKAVHGLRAEREIAVVHLRPETYEVRDSDGNKRATLRLVKN